jgi:hypothetical protein
MAKQDDLATLGLWPSRQSARHEVRLVLKDLLTGDATEM